MPDKIRDKKAAALLIVLGIILVVTVLVNVVLQIMLNQAKLTHHQIGRIQAHYAANAALVYAWERLMTGDYVAGTDCYAADCEYEFASGDFDPPLVDPTTRIRILLHGDAGCVDSPDDTACIIASADYSTD